MAICVSRSTVQLRNAGQRAKEKGLPPTQRTAPGRLVEGATVQGWKAALGALALAYPDRLAGYLTCPRSSVMAIPSRRAGGVHVERPQRSEDERRGHRQAVEDDQQRRKSLPLTDHLHRHLDKLKPPAAPAPRTGPRCICWPRSTTLPASCSGKPRSTQRPTRSPRSLRCSTAST